MVLTRSHDYRKFTLLPSILSVAFGAMTAYEVLFGSDTDPILMYGCVTLVLIIGGSILQNFRNIIELGHESEATRGDWDWVGLFNIRRLAIGEVQYIFVRLNASRNGYESASA